MTGRANAPHAARPAVFLDRDGTLNVDTNYVHQFDEWEWILGAQDAVRTLNGAGFLVLVVTNQGGIARQLYGGDDVERLHRRVDEELRSASARIDGYYYCPHHPEFGERTVCDCRKPEPGMLLRAARDWNVDLASSFMVGDKASDILAGTRAGVRSILVSTGYGRDERAQVPPGTPFADHILAAVEMIVKQKVAAAT